MLRILIISLAVLAWLAPQRADACSCGPVDGPEEAYARASVIFVGTVGTTRQVGTHDYETAFAVGEVFRGAPGKTAIVASLWNGGSCDHGRYPNGERMLIYARGSGKLRVSGCSGTKRVADAAADLAYLRALAKAPAAVIAGEVRFSEDPYDDDGDDPQPRANVEIRARGTRYATRTTKDGRYRLALPPGTYELEVRDPDPNLAPLARVDDKPIELREIGSYARRHFMVTFNGRIRGRLRDHRGRPAANMHVLAVRDGKRHAGWARTDANGRYELRCLPEGTYRVTLTEDEDAGAKYPPTAAKRVAVPRAGLVTGVDLRLPLPRQLFKLQGIVVRERASARYPNAVVTVIDTRDRRRTEHSAVGDEATFEIEAAAGSVLKIYACDGALGDGTCTKTTILTLDRDRTVTLTLPE